MNAYQINLRNKLSELSNLRNSINDILKKEKLADESLQKELLLALTELFVNFVKHGNGKAQHTIDIFICISIDKIDFVIHDDGNAYTPVIKQPDISQLPEGGYGLFIITSVMDCFQYFPKNSDRNYNITKLTKIL